MTTQELHVALLAEIFGYEVPCESEHSLLRYARMLSNGSIVPYTKCANDASENVMKDKSHHEQAQMRTKGYTHETFTSVRPNRSCSQAREAKVDLATRTESDCASWGLAMVGYAILSLSQHAVNATTTTSPRRTTKQHEQTKIRPMHYTHSRAL